MHLLRTPTILRRMDRRKKKVDRHFISHSSKQKQIGESEIPELSTIMSASLRNIGILWRVLTIHFLCFNEIEMVNGMEDTHHNIFTNVGKKNANTKGGSSNKKPNIMVIFADDVGTGDVPGYWNSGSVNMPNIEELLVQKGTVFSDVHSTPLCSPSRYVLLSGNYQHRGFLYGGTWKVNYKSGSFREGQQTIADVLRSNGYHTAMFGKWHLGGEF